MKSYIWSKLFTHSNKFSALKAEQATFDALCRTSFMTVISYVANDLCVDFDDVIERFAYQNPHITKVSPRFAIYFNNNGWEWIEIVNEARRIRNLEPY